MKSLHKIAEIAQTQPDTLCIKTEERVFTYGDFEQWIENFAQKLRKDFGNQANVRIGIVSELSLDFLIAYFGVLKAGYTAVLFPAQSLSHDQQINIPKTSVRGMAFSGSFSGVIHKLESQQGMPFEKYKMDNLNSIPDYVKSEGRFPVPHISADAVIFYTSGSSGTPKQVVYSRKAINANVDLLTDLIKLKGTEKICSILPSDNFVTSILAVHTVFANTGIYILTDSESLKPDLIQSSGMNILFSTPKYLKQLLKQEPEPEKLDNLKICFCFGRNRDPELIFNWEKKFGSQVFTSYGLTEAPIVAVNRKMPIRKRHFIGKIIPGVEWKIINVMGAEVGSHEEGELMVRSDGNLSHYYSEKFQHLVNTNGWLHTGDIVMKDDWGSLFFSEQKNSQIYRYGFLIDPTDLENKFIEHPKIEDVAVIKLIGETHNRIKICVVPKEGENLAKDEIFKFARETLPKYLYPDFVEFYTQIPRNPFGNIINYQLINFSISTN